MKWFWLFLSLFINPAAAQIVGGFTDNPQPGYVYAYFGPSFGGGWAALSGTPNGGMGRLSLDQAAAITTADWVGATTIYYVPQPSDQIPINDGSGFIFRQMVGAGAIALDATFHTANTNFDLFACWNGQIIQYGTGPDWAVGGGTGITRGAGANSTELQFIHGVAVNRWDINLRNSGITFATYAAGNCTLLGSIRTTSAGQTEDSFTNRFVSNVNNQAIRILRRSDPMANWDYSTANFRQQHGDTANKVSTMFSLPGHSISLKLRNSIINSTTTRRAAFGGIAINHATTNSGTTSLINLATLQSRTLTDSTTQGFDEQQFDGYAELGFSEWVMLEKGAGVDTQTWWGSDSAANNIQTGMNGWILN